MRRDHLDVARRKLELRKQVAQTTTDFLGRQLEQAKHDLDEQDTKLAKFKSQHLGRLPSDVENNFRILTGLESQLEASTQVLNRAQQDKSYAEMRIAQELAAWKAAMASPNFPSLRQELIQLQDKLVTLQSLYTEDHPDVVKIEHEIARVKTRLKEINADAIATDTTSTTEERPFKMEPPEVVRLREQVRRNDSIIERANAQQKQLQERIDSYQNQLTVSPAIEEEYKQLTRDSTTAHDLYNSLLTNKNSAVIQTEMERSQEGEQLKLLDPGFIPGFAELPGTLDVCCLRSRRRIVYGIVLRRLD